MAQASVATPFAPFVYNRWDGGEETPLEFHIVGGEAQVLQVLLPPGQDIQAEPGALFYMNSRISVKTKAGGSIISALSRILTGESYFVNTYTNEGTRPEYVAFATHMINRILPLDLNTLGGEMYCQQDSYFCSVGDVRVTSKMVKSFSAGFFGGEGMVLQKLEGKGLCFITAGGTPVQKKLARGETVYVDAGCLVAFQSTVSYNLQYTGSVKSAIFGGEGIFMQKLTGPGIVILESLPKERLIATMNPQAKVRKNRQNTCGGLIAIAAVLITVFVLVAALLDMDVRVVHEGLRHLEL